MPSFAEAFPHLVDPSYLIPNLLPFFMAITLGCFMLWLVENRFDIATDWFFRLGRYKEKKNDTKRV